MLSLYKLMEKEENNKRASNGSGKSVKKTVEKWLQTPQACLVMMTTTCVNGRSLANPSQTESVVNNVLGAEFSDASITTRYVQALKVKNPTKYVEYKD